MRNLLSLGIGLVFVSSAASCVVSVDDEPADDDGNNNTGNVGNVGNGGNGGNPPVTGDLLALSFNTGLSDGFVDHARERSAPAIDALSDIGANIICAQEVYDQNDHAALVAALGSPSTVVSEAQPDTVAGACQANQLTALRTCIDESCDGAAELACLTDTCAAEVGEQADVCQSCIFASTGSSSGDLVTGCSGNSAPLFAHGGAFGLVLATSSAIVDQDTLVLDSALHRRGVVYGRVDSAVGELHTFCTQLSPASSTLPYTGGAASWEAENQAQVEALLDFIEEKAPSGQVLLLGDLGAGPAGASYEAVGGPNFERFVAAGFESPYIDGDEACSFCGTSNPLASGADTLPDHVLLRGFAGSAGAARVLDEPLTVDVGGTDVDTAYSHHYGIFAALEND